MSAATVTYHELPLPTNSNWTLDIAANHFFGQSMEAMQNSNQTNPFATAETVLHGYDNGIITEISQSLNQSEPDWMDFDYATTNHSSTKAHANPALSYVFPNSLLSHSQAEATPPTATAALRPNGKRRTSSPSEGCHVGVKLASYASVLEKQEQPETAVATTTAVSVSSSTAALASSTSGGASIIPEELCLVCGDKASGYHYNALTCEGCKGFFRRSITRKAMYYCKYGGSCDIDMYMRRKCQACRLRKCLEIGMRPELVIPEDQCRMKRESKLKNRTNSNDRKSSSPHQQVTSTESLSPSATSAATGLTPEQRELIHRLVLYQDQFDVPSDAEISKLSTFQSQDDNETENANFQHLAELTILSVQLIMEFTKHLPGFSTLHKQDQLTLLKACSTEILMLRTARRYDARRDTIVLGNKTTSWAYTREAYKQAGIGPTTEAIFDFAKSMAKMKVDNAEYALLTAITIFSERFGLLEPKKVEDIQEVYTCALQAYMDVHRPKMRTTFARLLMKLTDLRTLGSEQADNLFSLKLNHQSTGISVAPPRYAGMSAVANGVGSRNHYAYADNFSSTLSNEFPNGQIYESGYCSGFYDGTTDQLISSTTVCDNSLMDTEAHVNGFGISYRPMLPSRQVHSKQQNSAGQSHQHGWGTVTNSPYQLLFSYNDNGLISHCRPPTEAATSVSVSAAQISNAILQNEQRLPGSAKVQQAVATANGGKPTQREQNTRAVSNATASSAKAVDSYYESSQTHSHQFLHCSSTSNNNGNSGTSSRIPNVRIKVEPLQGANSEEHLKQSLSEIVEESANGNSVYVVRAQSTAPSFESTANTATTATKTDLHN